MTEVRIFGIRHLSSDEVRNTFHAIMAGMAVACIGGVLGYGAIVTAPGRAASEAALVAKADSSTYPFGEDDSVAGCLGLHRGVAACILAERSLRAEGEPLWRGAPHDRRMSCIRRADGVLEPAAILYGCLRE